MSPELLSSIEITHVLDCIADPTKIRVVAEFSDDVSEAMPYCSTTVKVVGTVILTLVWTNE